MRREAHIGYTHKMRNVYKIIAGKSEVNRPLATLQNDEKLMLKWFLKK
jgi:hypothetical protein